MAKTKFQLPPVSPLMGSSVSVFRDTMKGNSIAPQFKTKKRITGFLVYLLSPFRWYENIAVLPRARKCKPEELVFIIGHWRGGTTYLHNLMCQAVNATYITTYQTVFPNFMGAQWLFRPIMRKVMPDRRPGDNLRLSVELPQEEEFAFANVNPHAYYKYMYFPENYDKYYRECVHFEGLSDRERKNFARDYGDVLHKAVWNRKGDMLVVKNPVNTGRLDFLIENFPGAKFIHLYRNPYTVYRSTLKFFTELLPTLVFNPTTREFIDQMILDVYVRVHEDLDQALSRNPDIDLIEVKFETFEKAPVAELEKIYQQLGLKDFEASRTAFEQYVSARRSYKKNVYEFPQELIEKVDRHWGKYVKRWGYEVPVAARQK